LHIQPCGLPSNFRLQENKANTFYKVEGWQAGGKVTPSSRSGA